MTMLLFLLCILFSIPQGRSETLPVTFILSLSSPFRGRVTLDIQALNSEIPEVCDCTIRAPPGFIFTSRSLPQNESVQLDLASSDQESAFAIGPALIELIFPIIHSNSAVLPHFKVAHL
eukprot:GHVT01097525.1.p3 GENE.GHVT01097525.1~~GHVT01097525.1.p3  ORF type:complete len:119 (+),score=0.86 GHVT01097525.1:182-538(+)